MSLKKCNRGFQTLQIVSIFMWIAHAFIHACWYSNDNSSHLGQAPPYLMPSYKILSLPHCGDSMVKMISLNDDEEFIHKIFMKFQ